MIRMKENNIVYLVGSGEVEKHPLPVYSDIVCSFLDELSGVLRKDNEAKKYPDILTFAFWCRRANICKLKEEYSCTSIQMGRGMVFHIAPSNVPVNFAFSLVFGMLSGNGNVVRVSEKEFPQTKIICKALKAVLQKSQYEILLKQTQVIQYGHQKEITDAFSAQCDARIIWGGDASIAKIRESAISSRCVEIAFADRYSFCIMDEQGIGQKSEKQMQQLAEGFYNDTYLMDQNACSSPHMVFWVNPDQEQKGRARFWEKLVQVAQKYDIPEKKVMDKYMLLCEKAVEIKECRTVTKYQNLLYVVDLEQIPIELESVRGTCGMFFQVDCQKLDDIIPVLNTKMQTCVYDGIEPKKLAEIIVQKHAQGIDRIVPIGKSMDIGVYWDGYDIIRSLSREIVVG